MLSAILNFINGGKVAIGLSYRQIQPLTPKAGSWFNTQEERWSAPVPLTLLLRATVL